MRIARQVFEQPELNHLIFCLEKQGVILRVFDPHRADIEEYKKEMSLPWLGVPTTPPRHKWIVQISYHGIVKRWPFERLSVPVWKHPGCFDVALDLFIYLVCELFPHNTAEAFCAVVPPNNYQALVSRFDQIGSQVLQLDDALVFLFQDSLSNLILVCESLRILRTYEDWIIGVVQKDADMLFQQLPAKHLRGEKDWLIDVRLADAHSLAMSLESGEFVVLLDDRLPLLERLKEYAERRCPRERL